MFGQPGGANDIPDVVQAAAISSKVSTFVPIEMACRKRHKAVGETLLLGTGVNHPEGTVFRHGLHLDELDVSWL